MLNSTPQILGAANVSIQEMKLLLWKATQNLVSRASMAMTINIIKGLRGFRWLWEQRTCLCIL